MQIVFVFFAAKIEFKNQYIELWSQYIDMKF